MLSVLLIDTDKDLQKLIALNLNAYVGAESILCHSCSSAVDILDSGSKVDVIICRDSLGGEDAAPRILNYLNDNNKLIPLIVIGKIKEDNSMVISIPSGDWREVIRVTAKTLEVTSSQMFEDHQSLDKLYPIKVQYLLDIDVQKCATDVYVKNGDSYDVYLEKGESFPSIILTELTKDGENYLYVEKSERLKFVNQFSENIINKLSDKDLVSEEKMKIGEICFDTIKDQIKMVGMKEQAIELAESQIQNMANLIEDGDPLFDLVRKLKENTNSFLYQHSILTAMICTQVTAKIEWASEEHIKKICFISLFHDVILEDDTQARISSNEELEESKIDDNAKKTVLTHALQASNLVKANPNRPFGADNIILQHHGQSNGIGFNDNLSSSISQLTIIFMVAEDYAETILDIDPEFFNRENIISSMRNKYNKGMYKKVIDILEKL